MTDIKILLLFVLLALVGNFLALAEISGSAQRIATALEVWNDGR